MTQKIHAFTNDALGDLDAVGIAERIRNKDVSAREVAEAAIARAKCVEDKINAIELATFEQAVQAADRPHTGIFAGVPTFVKDNTDLVGLPTNHGSLAVNARPAKADNAFAQQYLSLGLISLGKSSLPEFGFNASTEYMHAEPTRNPWHTEYSSGASSGGSAALVAAGVVPIAHANDGGGSIRIPASACGLIGLKPTRGRLVDAEAARSLPVNIVSEGVVTRSVRDTAHFYAGAEQFYRNPKLPPVGLVKGPGSRPLRIGLVHDSITGHATDAQTRATVEATARLLEIMGHRVEEMPLPVKQSFANDFSIYWGMLSFLVSVFGKRIMSPDFDASKMDNLSQGLASLYKRNMFKTPMVLYRLKKTLNDYALVFKQYDLVLSPVAAHTTPKLGWLSPSQDFDVLFDRLLRYVSFTPLNNASGSPAISLPMGVTTEGLPIAVQFSAAHGDERSLLEISYALEQAHPWRRIQD
ncbi:MAG: amidase [Moraxellaceae bacterium]|mgnify:CR=1 FL=1|nr:amidase [Moraxellaceae bacterium]MCC6200802.1 amidase [Moraxellaceae bacterium]